MSWEALHEHDGYAPHSHEVRADHLGVRNRTDVNYLLERLRRLSDEERRSLLAFMAGRNTQVLAEAMDAWEMAGVS